MVDDSTMLTAGGLLASKDLLEKLLGPTVEYLGAGGRELVERSTEHAARIFRIAMTKVGDAINDHGQVSPRVLKAVLQEGVLSNDALMAEYFGGLLAASREAEGEGDSSLSYLKLLEGMTSNEIHAHFVIYWCLAQLPYGSECEMKAGFWDLLLLDIGIDEIWEGFPAKRSIDEAVYQVEETLVALADNRLILPTYGIRLADYGVVIGDHSFGYNGIRVRPTRRGASLFLKALGFQALPPDVITSVDVPVRLSNEILQVVTKPVHFDSDFSPLTVDDDFSEFESRLTDVEDYGGQIKQIREELERLSEGKEA